MVDPFAPLSGKGNSHEPAKPAASWAPVLPVSRDAPPAPKLHPKLGAPSATWCYRGAADEVLFYVWRFDASDGKAFRPLTLWRSGASGATQWRWQALPAPRPLYGLPGLAKAPSAPVVLCEGEKSADAAARLLPGFVAVTSPNGSKSAGMADWAPLKGRHVTIWPDADVAGLDFGNTAAKLIAKVGAASVRIVSPPTACAVGWDAADAEREGWTDDQALALINAAKEFAGVETAAEKPKKERGRRGRELRNRLFEIVDRADLWHDPTRTAFASFPVGNHKENWRVRSQEFKMWVCGEFYRETGATIGGQALEDVLRTIEARAVFEGEQAPTFNRVGRQGDCLYLDLGDPTWRGVEIAGDGWRIVHAPPIKFLRSPSMLALPEPESGYEIAELRRFVNVKSDDDFALVVGSLVSWFRDLGPYPILVVNGEQGSGKSIFSRFLRSLVDPSAAPIRAMPKDDRDLIVSAWNSHVLAYDNLSAVPAWFSDALCRLSTGGGFAARQLHTDRDEVVFDGQRPILLNGIPMLTDRADLADRAVTIHLRSIPEEERRPQDELVAEFQAVRPRILGALLDAVSAALRNLHSVKLKRSPRMADFVKWVSAAECGLGWDPETFLAAYDANRKDVSEATFEADPVAIAIRDFMTEHPTGWEGSPTDLLAALNLRVSEGTRKSRRWPMTAQGLGNQMERIKPLLREKGITIERRHSGTRSYVIVPVREFAI